MTETKEVPCVQLPTHELVFEGSGDPIFAYSFIDAVDTYIKDDIVYIDRGKGTRHSPRTFEIPIEKFEYLKSITPHRGGDKEEVLIDKPSS